jgi:putative peptidoglycan lipid II flippase
VLTLRVLPLGATHAANLIRLVAGSVVWLIVVAAVLLATKSSLPNAVLRRKKT